MGQAVEFKFLHWSRSSVGLPVGIQSAGDSVLETPWVRILHSGEEGTLSPFDSNIVCLCQSIEINNTHTHKHTHTHIYIYACIVVNHFVFYVVYSHVTGTSSIPWTSARMMLIAKPPAAIIFIIRIWYFVFNSQLCNFSIGNSKKCIDVVSNEYSRTGELMVKIS